MLIINGNRLIAKSTSAQVRVVRNKDQEYKNSIALIISAVDRKSTSSTKTLGFTAALQ